MNDGAQPLILVVHEDRETRLLAAKILGSAYRVEFAPDLASASSTIRANRPDLILASLAARLDEALAGIPVIRLFDRAAGEPKLQGNAPTTDDWLGMPFAAAELLARVEANLRWARARHEAEGREKALLAEAEAFRNRVTLATAHLPFSVTVFNPQGVITYANAARDRILRHPSLPPVGAAALADWPAFHADGRPLANDEFPVQRALRGELVQDLDVQYDRGDGNRIWLRVSGLPVFDPEGKIMAAIAVAVDITDQKRAELELRQLTETLEQRVQEEISERFKAEASLRQAQKMQAIGQLTGGVAHDFNNLLQIVIGNLDSLQRQVEALPDPSRGRMTRPVEAALRGADRAAQLTRQLLAFSRRQSLDPSVIDVNQLVLGMTELLRRTLGERIAIDTKTADALPPVYADRNQLESALLNLAVNARDAMPESGRLTIETAPARIAQRRLAQPDELMPGDFVMIAVRDSGSGIDREILPQVFEPFFTTKEAGKGTGLGLSQVYGFVKQSGGQLEIESELGHGTAIKLYLPPHRAPAAADGEAMPDVPETRRARGELVLLVEDDPDVRAYSAEVLRELGYRIVEAVTGREALLHLAAQPEIALLFTDIGLPGGMNGLQLAEEAVRRGPGLKVLFTTAYARDTIHHGDASRRLGELITKPFTFAALAAKLRQLLETD